MHVFWSSCLSRSSPRSPDGVSLAAWSSPRGAFDTTPAPPVERCRLTVLCPAAPSCSRPYRGPRASPGASHCSLDAFQSHFSFESISALAQTQSTIPPRLLCHDLMAALLLQRGGGVEGGAASGLGGGGGTAAAPSSSSSRLKGGGGSGGDHHSTATAAAAAAPLLLNDDVLATLPRLALKPRGVRPTWHSFHSSLEVFYLIKARDDEVTCRVKHSMVRIHTSPHLTQPLSAHVPHASLEVDDTGTIVRKRHAGGGGGGVDGGGGGGAGFAAAAHSSQFRCATALEPQLLVRGRRRLTLRLLDSAQLKLGVCAAGFDPTRSSEGHASATPFGWALYAHNGQLRHNSNSSGAVLGKPAVAGDTLAIELDADAGVVAFWHNGRPLGELRDGGLAGAAFTGVPRDAVFCAEIKDGGCQIMSYC